MMTSTRITMITMITTRGQTLTRITTMKTTTVPGPGTMSLTETTPTTVTRMMITGSATGTMMTDMEPDNPGPLLRHMRAQNAALREEIVREIADLPQADLRGVLRMIEVWKGAIKRLPGPRMTPLFMGRALCWTGSMYRMRTFMPSPSRLAGRWIAYAEWASARAKTPNARPRSSPERSRAMSDLMPCPFCGGDADQDWWWNENGDGGGRGKVICIDCGAEAIGADPGWHHTAAEKAASKSEAAAFWNRRALPSVTVQAQIGAAVLAERERCVRAAVLAGERSAGMSSSYVVDGIVAAIRKGGQP
jgi:hypothetical protein